MQLNDDKPYYIVQDGKHVENSWLSNTWDLEKKEFKFKILGLKDNFGKAPYNVMIYVKVLGGAETVYYQEDDSGYKRIPYFWVKSTTPKKPTLKLLSVSGKKAVFEGTAEKGSILSVVKDSGEEITSTKQIYSDDEKATEGKWQKEVDGLKEGDYIVYAKCIDFAGNVSPNSSVVKFSILGAADIVPQIGYPTPDSVINGTRYPEIRGVCSIRSCPGILIFDNGNRIGETQSDSAGKFVFKPTIPLYNGYHNITARVYKD